MDMPKAYILKGLYQCKTTALISKGIKIVYFGVNYEHPWPGNTNLGFPKFDVPNVVTV